MPLADYYALVPPLILPIRGKSYELPIPAAADVARWKVFAEKTRLHEEIPAGEVVTTDEFRRIFLGDQLDAMITDGVLIGVIDHAAGAAMADAEFGRDVAEKVWSTPNPKDLLLVPNPPHPTDSTPSPSTGAASTTKRPARTSGTKPRRK